MYTPVFPYNQEQIIINSDRVVLNSKLDSIFLFSDKIISLSSNEGVHVNTSKGIYMNGEEIRLGLKADNPIPKGNETTEAFNKILDTLDNVGGLLLSATDSNGNPIPQVVTAGNTLQKSSKRIKTLIKKINSKQNYTL